jgi:hypothetical protein
MEATMGFWGSRMRRSDGISSKRSKRRPARQGSIVRQHLLMEAPRGDRIVGARAGGSENNRFELRDISVLFPEGKLSVITGPLRGALQSSAFTPVSVYSFIPFSGENTAFLGPSSFCWPKYP